MSLRQHIQSSIRQFVQQHDDEHLPVDVLRIIQEEAALMKETSELHDVFIQDPFQLCTNIHSNKNDDDQNDDNDSNNDDDEHVPMPKSMLERFRTSLRVVECSRQRVGHDNCRIDAVVEIVNNATTKNSNNMNTATNPRLTFRYVRQPRSCNVSNGNGNDNGENQAKSSSTSNSKPCHVWYSIEHSMLGLNSPRQTLLVVEIFAPKSVPTTDVPAVCINQDDDDDDNDDDNDDDDDNNSKNDSKMSVDNEKEEEEEEDGWEDIEDDDDAEESSHDDQETHNNNKAERRIRPSSPNLSSKRRKHEHDSNSDNEEHNMNDRNLDSGGDDDDEEKGVDAEMVSRTKDMSMNSTREVSTIDDDDDENGNYDSKNGRIGDDPKETHPTDDLPTTHDSYIAYLDPGVLYEFVKTNFGGRNHPSSSFITEATAFYILMMFPFYEQEWDIVGYVLDEVFGPDDEDNEDDGNDDDDEEG